MLQKIQTPLLGLCPLSGTMWILRRKIFWNFYIQFVCQSKQRQEKQSTCIWMLFPWGNGSPPVKINKCFCMRRTYEEKYITLLQKKWKINLVEWCDVRAIAIAGALSSMMDSNWMSLKWKLFWSQNLRCLKHD